MISLLTDQLKTKKKNTSLLISHTECIRFKVLNKLVFKIQASLITMSSFHKKGITLSIFEAASLKVKSNVSPYSQGTVYQISTSYIEPFFSYDVHSISSKFLYTI